MLIWQASAPEMNPTLSANYLARMEQDDPEGYRSEILGEFRAGVMTFLDPDALDRCVDRDVRERLHRQGVSYVAGFDASGGRADRAVLAIAHALEDGRGDLDLLRAWNPPHNPAHVIAEASEILKSYHVNAVSGDRYAAEFVVAAFAEHGIAYLACDRDRSSLYLELQPAINAARVRLLDDPELLRELRGLERRRGAARDRVDHRPGAHDDRAVAATVALIAATSGNLGPLDHALMAMNATPPSVGAAQANNFYGGGANSRSVFDAAFGGGGMDDVARKAFGS
jgi:hypothetical protein